VNSRWGVRQLAILRDFHPDIVIMEFAINDAAVHRGVSLPESISNIRCIIDFFRKTDNRVQIYLLITNPVHGLRRILRFRLERYYEEHRRLADALSVTCIDTRPAWNGLPRPLRRLAIPDGVHPAPHFARSITLREIVHVLAGELSRTPNTPH
jgi:lysophospholipase L1-like esterase